MLIPYVQMYEFEGLLFSSPSAIASVLQNDGLESWACGAAESYRTAH
jgi:hypothetical protein